MNEREDRPADDEIPAELAQVKRVRSAPLAAVGGLLLVASLITLWVSRDGWRYALRSDTPQDLGRVEDALKKGTLQHNTYVSLTARPILNSEGKLKMGDPAPGCLNGPVRTLYYTLAAETGDRLVLRTVHSLRKRQSIAKRIRLQGRLVRLDPDGETHRMYRRFIYRMTDCKSHPRKCDRSLLVGADISRDQLLPKLGRAQATLQARDGLTIDVKPTTPLFLKFRYPRQWDYRLSNISRKEAIEKVQGLGVPWIFLETRGDDQYFVLQAPKAVGERLIREQRRGKGYSISSRTAEYLTTFGWLRKQGNQLIIRKVGPGFPEDYRVGPPAAGAIPSTLHKVTHRGHVRVPLERFVKASYHGPRRLPQRAWLLVQGRRPRNARPAALLALGMVILGLVGLGLLILGLRRPR